MKQKELTNIFMMILKQKYPFGLNGLYKNEFSALRAYYSQYIISHDVYIISHDVYIISHDVYIISRDV